MTPGFAKSRAELPWLYYPRNDRVIINAHNFTPTFSASVNGKAPIAAWIESRDTQAVTSSVATDLATGAYPGTLTNMDLVADPDTARIADTGAGGSRALLFDGSNDYVDCGDIAAFDFGTGAFAVSFWMKAPNRAATWAVVCKDDWDSGLTGLLFFGDTGSPNQLFYYSGASRNYGAILDNNWHHVGVSRSGTGANQTATYLDGALVSSFQDARNLTNAFPFRLGNDKDGNRGFSGRLDDVRVWNQSLVLADFQSLYASGAGRGVQA